MTIPEAIMPTGIPCSHPPHKGAADVYVTYQLLGQTGILYADGKEQETAVSYSVDLYVKGDYIADMIKVKTALETAGYIVSIDTEYLENDVDLYHVSMTATIEGAAYG